MFYLQSHCSMTGQWERQDGEFNTALEALEKRDALKSGAPNDGVDHGWRVVDDSGDVLEYGTRQVEA